MKLKVPEPMEEKLKNMEKSDQEKIKKKLEEIEQRLKKWDDPDKAIEKRLTGPLHPLLQQRVGKWRLWFEEDRKNSLVRLLAIKTKKEAKKQYY